MYWAINTLDKGLAKLDLKEPSPSAQKEEGEVFFSSKQGVCWDHALLASSAPLGLPLGLEEGMVQAAHEPLPEELRAKMKQNK